MVRIRAGARGKGYTRGVFRFMDLPPELRVRIYEHVLPGKIMHVDLPRHREGVRSISVCQALVADQVWAASYLATQPPPETRDGCFNFDGVCERHFDCRTAPFKARELAILSVCRQLYNEAALMHIQNSIFICDGPQYVVQLCHTLTATQQAAIKTLRLRQSHGGVFWRLGHQHSTWALKGLKHLEIYAELVTIDFRPVDQSDTESGIATVRGQDRSFRYLQKFQGFPLRSVDVVIVNVAPSMKSSLLLPVKMPTQAELTAWEARVRQMIMPGLDAELDEKDG